MIERIEVPMARAVLTWRTAEEGGRKTGPPTARVYAATCVFLLGDDATVHPGWPAAGDALSILLEASDSTELGSTVCKVDFLARDLARPLLHVGAEFLVLEGPSVVGRGRTIEVVPELDGD
ncbi:hypothetical protein ACTHAM_003274 [Cellulomonas soli]|uniref:hypothetical protein n=1 Tax=Cellulomonas soli TaxID=931535 RepID=UPI003F846853